ncbi:MAG TPA: hypothetical protein VMN36_16880 [Verrucomicrobiales bacterium]|nr:hypothetical protein [Verrucomicrobiales bacterium]
MRLIIVSILAATGVGSAAAQTASPVTPSHPTRFETRGVGSGVGAGVSVSEVKRTEVKKTVFIAVSPDRQWTSTDGRTITGSLVAFEEGEVDNAPRPLTLIKDGKIRVLKSGTTKPPVFPITLLTEEDLSYVQALDVSNKASAARADAEALKDPF